MNFVSYSPDNSNGISSKSIKFLSALMIIFYFRYLVVGIISAYFLLLPAAAFFPWTRSFAMMLFSYGAVMLFFKVPHVPDIAGRNRIDEWTAVPLDQSLLLYFVITLGALLAGVLCICIGFLAVR